MVDIREDRIVVRNLEYCEVDGCRKKATYGGLCVDHAGPIRASAPDTGIRSHSLDAVDYSKFDRKEQLVRTVEKEKQMAFRHKQGNKSLEDYHETDEAV